MLAKEITSVPFNAADACRFTTLIVTEPAAGVTSPTAGSPALFVPFAIETKAVSAAAICELIKVRV
jgi:hypothetical protein